MTVLDDNESLALAIRGDKGGSSGSQHTPTEAADNLRSTAYATVLDLVSEGEIEGFALGTAKMGQCIALDGTPIDNPDGSHNFSNVTIDSRTGTPTQDYIQGVPDVENAIAVGVRLRADTPWVQNFSNTALSAVRVILSVPNGLQKSDKDTGDITGYLVSYKIELSVDGGAYTTVLTGAFQGKASGKYQRAHRIDLPKATTGWNVRVTRTTPEADSALIADRTDVDAYVQIVDKKLAYPDSALVSVSIDASQFSSIPTRAYRLKGRIVRVPSNYDPVTRVYTGVWDGTFKPAYTNNPAWQFFDMATNTRYGLGKFLSDAQIDKWSLYTIAQYCDQLVDDGNGGQEPRFTGFLYLQERADAYKVMQDMATMFRGISYYTGSAIQAVADMPADPVYIYDNSNVIEGKFTYGGSSLTSRHTVALVSWNDLSDFGKAKVEYVEDAAGIARYGVRTTEVMAVGCTSRMGAHRVGQHILLTNRLETETVSFGVGLDGELAAPGQIIKIVDHNRAGKRQGGRIKSATTVAITVDQAPDVAIGDTLTVNMPDGVSQTRTISGVTGAVLSVGAAFTETPQAEAVWMVEKTTLAAQTFRVISVVENNDGEDTLGFTLSCIQHAPEKFAAIDGGILLPPRPISGLTSPTQDPVTGITISQRIVFRQEMAVTVMQIAWEKPAGAVRYTVDWRRDNGTWVSVGNVTETETEVEDVYEGVYQARIVAYNANGVPSAPVISTAVQLDGKTSPPPVPTLYAQGALFQIDLWWDFPTDVNVSDTSYTEIEVDVGPDMATAEQLGTYAYPLNVATISNLGVSETRWARARLVDKSGNIGDWCAPVSATTNNTDELFKDINDASAVLEQHVDDLQARVDSLTIDNIANAKQWVQTDAYAAGTLVYDGGKLYRAKQAVPPGTLITATSYWELLGDYATLRGDLDAAAANISTLQTTVSGHDDQISANVTAINQQAAQIADKADATALTALSTTVASQGDEIVAHTSSITSLQANTAGLGARIDAEQVARADGDTANASALTSISARMPAGTGKVATQASVDSETSARVSGDSANASEISGVKATINNPTTGLAATAAVATQAKASADAATGKVNASYTLKVDGGGRVAGMVAQSDGTVSDITFVADNFRVVSPAGGARTEYSNGSWKVYDSSGVLRIQLGVF